MRLLLFECLWFSSGSLWIQSLGFFGFSWYPESAFLSAVSLASATTVRKKNNQDGVDTTDSATATSTAMAASVMSEAEASRSQTAFRKQARSTEGP